MLGAMHGLGILYANQGKLGEAEKMYQRALKGYEKVLDLGIATSYVPVLITFYKQKTAYDIQGDIDRARAMYSRALVGYQRVFEHDHPSCQDLRDRLATLETSVTD